MNELIKQRIEQIRRGEVPEGYKKTKVGVVPNDWEENRLSHYLKVNNDKNVDLKYGKEDVFSISGELGIVNQIELLGRSYAGASVAPYGIVYPNDVVYTKSPLKANPYGIIKTNKTGKVGIVSTLYAVFHCKENVSPNFVQTYFEWDKNLNNYLYPIVNIGAKHDMKISDENSLKGYVVFPHRSEQEKIAEILSMQDKLISLKEKLIEEKKLQKKALMQQLLTGKKRVPNFSDTWRTSKLSNVLVEGSKIGVTDTSLYKKMTVKLAFKGLEFTKTDREMVDTRPFYIRNKNEIIIGKQNYFNGSVALVTDEFDGCICSNAIMSFSVKNADVKFILEYISQTDFMKKREMLANGTGQKELSEKDFLNFDILLPCIDEQKRIGAIASTYDSEILLLQKELDQEKQKKKALMQLLLTGIVRV